MQGFLTFVTMACAAAFQVPIFADGLQSHEPDCLLTSVPRAPSLDQRLAALGVPEVHEVFGLHVAETPEVLRRSWSSPPPYSRGGLEVR